MNRFPLTGSVRLSRKVSAAKPRENDQYGGMLTPVPPGSVVTEEKTRRGGLAICVVKDEWIAGTLKLVTISSNAEVIEPVLSSAVKVTVVFPISDAEGVPVNAREGEFHVSHEGRFVAV